MPSSMIAFEHILMAFPYFRPHPPLGILSTLLPDCTRPSEGYVQDRISEYPNVTLQLYCFATPEKPAQRSPHASWDCNFSKLLALLFMGFEEQVYSRTHRVPCDHIVDEHLIQ